MTVTDPKDRDSAIERDGVHEVYELDERSGDEKFVGDDGSERTIISQKQYGSQNGRDGKERPVKTKSFSERKNKGSGNGNGCEGRGGVKVEMKFDIKREARKSAGK